MFLPSDVDVVPRDDYVPRALNRNVPDGDVLANLLWQIDSFLASWRRAEGDIDPRWLGNLELLRAMADEAVKQRDQRRKERPDA